MADDTDGCTVTEIGDMRFVYESNDADVSAETSKAPVPSSSVSQNTVKNNNSQQQGQTDNNVAEMMQPSDAGMMMETRKVPAPSSSSSSSTLTPDTVASQPSQGQTDNNVAEMMQPSDAGMMMETKVPAPSSSSSSSSSTLTPDTVASQPLQEDDAGIAKTDVHGPGARDNAGGATSQLAVGDECPDAFDSLVISQEYHIPVSQLCSKEFDFSKKEHRMKKENILGEGAFGIVVRARHLTHGHVAVKLTSKQGQGWEKLQNEMNMLAKGNSHDNIVTVKGYTKTEDQFGIVMEFMENGSLWHFRTKRYGEVPPWAITVRMVHEIALGMSFLHSKKIIHRDLKLENVLIDRSFQVKISDLGLAVERSASLESRLLQYGTPTHKPPEAFRPPDDNMDVITEKYDVYSYSLTVYELLSGKHPFAKNSYEVRGYEELITWKCELNITPDVKKLECCPVELRDIMQKGWVQDASQRPSSIEIAEKTKTLHDAHSKDISSDTMKMLHKLSPPDENSASGASIPPVSGRPVMPPGEQARNVPSDPEAHSSEVDLMQNLTVEDSRPQGQLIRNNNQPPAGRMHPDTTVGVTGPEPARQESGRPSSTDRTPQGDIGHGARNDAFSAAADALHPPSLAETSSPGELKIAEKTKTLHDVHSKDIPSHTRKMLRKLSPPNINSSSGASIPPVSGRPVMAPGEQARNVRSDPEAHSSEVDLMQNLTVEDSRPRQGQLNRNNNQPPAGRMPPDTTVEVRVAGPEPARQESGRPSSTDQTPRGDIGHGARNGAFSAAADASHPQSMAETLPPGELRSSFSSTMYPSPDTLHYMGEATNFGAGGGDDRYNVHPPPVISCVHTPDDCIQPVHTAMQNTERTRAAAAGFQARPPNDQAAAAAQNHPPVQVSSSEEDLIIHFDSPSSTSSDSYEIRLRLSLNVNSILSFDPEKFQLVKSLLERCSKRNWWTQGMATQASTVLSASQITVKQLHLPKSKEDRDFILEVLVRDKSELEQLEKCHEGGNLAATLLTNFADHQLWQSCSPSKPEMGIADWSDQFKKAQAHFQKKHQGQQSRTKKPSNRRNQTTTPENKGGAQGGTITTGTTVITFQQAPANVQIGDQYHTHYHNATSAAATPNRNQAQRPQAPVNPSASEHQPEPELTNSSETVTESLMQNIADVTPGDLINAVGRHLGLNNIKVRNLLYGMQGERTEEKAFRVLNMWKQFNGKRATKKCLAIALWKAGCYEAARSVR